MSYENGTQYYNLPQTQGTDKRDWFDTNEAFRNVDTDLHTAMQNSETTQQSLEVTNQKVTLVEGRVQVAEENVATLQGDLATTNENVATNSGAIASLQTAVTNNKQDLEDMITAYEEATATASASHNVGDYFRYNDVLYITTITIRVGDTIVPDVNCRSTNVMTRVRALENQGGGQSPLASSVLYDNATSGLKATNVQSAIDEIDGTLDIVSQGVQTNSTHIGDLTALLTTAKGNLVGAINELVGMIGGGGMPTLNFSNPLHAFSADGNYTAVKDCYLGGVVHGRTEATITIDGTVVYRYKGITSSSFSGDFTTIIPWTKIPKGSTVTVTDFNYSTSSINIYGEA